MIDTSIPYYPLVMHKTDASNYPKYELPEGYKFVFYKDGDAEKWSEVQTAVGSFSSVEVGTQVFLRDFINGQMLDAKERVLFVTDEKGEYIGTASLWDGNEYGKRLQRIHWVAVKDEHGGKGIAKAMTASFLPSLFFLSAPADCSSRLTPRIPITMIATATQITGAISSPKNSAHMTVHIAPEVFSMGSERDSSINLMPKKEQAMDTI